MKLLVPFKNLVTLGLVLFSFICQSQSIKMGLKTDIDGQDFNDYYSPFTYQSKSHLTIRLTDNDKYEHGQYCTLDGKLHQGYLLLDEDNIKVKESRETNFPKSFKAQELIYIKIGIDSFTSSSNYYYKKKLSSKPRFIQYLGKSKGYVYGRFFNISTNKISTYYVVRDSSEKSVWINFYDKKKFNRRCLKYFGHLPQIKKKIEAESLTIKDIPNIIQMSIYNDKLIHKTPIFFDPYWQELPSKEKSSYKAFVTNKTDSIYTIEYYSNNSKIYKINYSSFYPKIKNGEFMSFFKNGNTRRIIKYRNDSIKSVKIFNEDEKLIKNYIYTKTPKESIKKNGAIRSSRYGNNPFIKNLPYIKTSILLLDDKGNNIVTKVGQFSISEKDSNTNQTYTDLYSNNKKIKSYKLINNDTIFQTIKQGTINLITLQTKLNYALEEKKFPQALKDNAQGTIFLSVLINPKGHVEQCSALNKLHPELDNFVVSFLEDKLLEGAKFRYKFKKIRPKGFYTTIIPIEISNNRFYRPPPADYNYWFMQHMMMQHPNMMQHPHMMQQPTINLPNGGVAPSFR